MYRYICSQDIINQVNSSRLLVLLVYGAAAENEQGESISAACPEERGVAGGGADDWNGDLEEDEEDEEDEDEATPVGYRYVSR